MASIVGVDMKLYDARVFLRLTALVLCCCGAGSGENLENVNQHDAARGARPQGALTLTFPGTCYQDPVWDHDWYGFAAGATVQATVTWTGNAPVGAWVSGAGVGPGGSSVRTARMGLRVQPGAQTVSIRLPAVPCALDYSVVSVTNAAVRDDKMVSVVRLDSVQVYYHAGSPIPGCQENVDVRGIVSATGGWRDDSGGHLTVVQGPYASKAFRNDGHWWRPHFQTDSHGIAMAFYRSEPRLAAPNVSGWPAWWPQLAWNWRILLLKAGPPHNFSGLSDTSLRPLRGAAGALRDRYQVACAGFGWAFVCWAARLTST